MAANNAAPLQPLPEFHTTVSSVNFECTRALSRKRTLAPIESTRPTGRRREEEPSHLGIKLRPPNKDNVSRCSSNTEQSKYRAGFSPPPLSLHLLLLPHIFVIFGSRMFMQRHKSNPNPHWMDINNSRATSKGQRAHKDACNCTTCASALAPRLCSPSRIENRRRLIPSPRNRTSSSCYAPSLHRERSLVEQKYPVTFFRSTDRHPPELGEIIL